MMNETEEMKQARWHLKVLTAADAAATANMMRNVAALALMIAGRRQQDKAPGEPEIAASFAFTKDEREIMMAVTACTGIDQVLIGFDVDDAGGPHCGIGVIRNEGEKVAFYADCQLWCPANDGNAVLVYMGSARPGHLAFRRGAGLRYLPSWPADDLEAGFRRAALRFRRIAESKDLRNVHREGYVNVFDCEAGALRLQATKLAA